MPSTVIAKIEYDESNRILSVIFLSGKVYYYKDVPKNVFITLRAAKSKGRYLNKYIKGAFEYESSEIE